MSSLTDETKAAAETFANMVDKLAQTNDHMLHFAESNDLSTYVKAEIKARCRNISKEIAGLRDITAASENSHTTSGSVTISDAEFLLGKATVIAMQDDNAYLQSGHACSLGPDHDISIGSGTSDDKNDSFESGPSNQNTARTSFSSNERTAPSTLSPRKLTYAEMNAIFPDECPFSEDDPEQQTAGGLHQLTTGNMSMLASAAPLATAYVIQSGDENCKDHPTNILPTTEVDEHVAKYGYGDNYAEPDYDEFFNSDEAALDAAARAIRSSAPSPAMGLDQSLARGSEDTKIEVAHLEDVSNHVTNFVSHDVSHEVDPFLATAQDKIPHLNLGSPSSPIVTATKPVVPDPSSSVDEPQADPVAIYNLHMALDTRGWQHTMTKTLDDILPTLPPRVKAPATPKTIEEMWAQKERRDQERNTSYFWEGATYLELHWQDPERNPLPAPDACRCHGVPGLKLKSTLADDEAKNSGAPSEGPHIRTGYFPPQYQTLHNGAMVLRKKFQLESTFMAKRRVKKSDSNDEKGTQPSTHTSGAAGSSSHDDEEERAQEATPACCPVCETSVMVGQNHVYPTDCPSHEEKDTAGAAVDAKLEQYETLLGPDWPSLVENGNKTIGDLVDERLEEKCGVSHGEYCAWAEEDAGDEFSHASGRVGERLTWESMVDVAEGFRSITRDLADEPTPTHATGAQPRVVLPWKHMVSATQGSRLATRHLAGQSIAEPTVPTTIMAARQEHPEPPAQASASPSSTQYFTAGSRVDQPPQPAAAQSNTQLDPETMQALESIWGPLPPPRRVTNPITPPHQVDPPMEVRHAAWQASPPTPLSQQETPPNPQDLWDSPHEFISAPRARDFSSGVFTPPLAPQQPSPLLGNLWGELNSLLLPPAQGSAQESAQEFRCHYPAADPPRLPGRDYPEYPASSPSHGPRGVKHVVKKGKWKGKEKEKEVLRSSAMERDEQSSVPHMPMPFRATRYRVPVEERLRGWVGERKIGVGGLMRELLELRDGE